MKLGLYSVTYSGTWFRGGLDVYGFMDKAAEYGFDGVEIDLKRPHGFPLDLSDDECKKIRAYAASKGLEIAAVAGNNNFSSPIAENIENELLMLHEQLRVAKALGAPLLRVFAAWRGVTFRDGIATYDITKEFDSHLDSTKDEIYDRVKACLKEGVAWAEEAGVVLALQNHPPVTDNYKVMLNIVSEIGSPWLKCCLDAPNCGYENQGTEYLTKAVRDVGALQMHTHASGEFEADKNGDPVLVPWDAYMTPTNYPAFVKALKETGFEGYLCYEFCHRPRKHGELLGMEYIDEQVQYAVKYFRQLMK